MWSVIEICGWGISAWCSRETRKFWMKAIPFWKCFLLSYVLCFFLNLCIDDNWGRYSFEIESHISAFMEFSAFSNKNCKLISILALVKFELSDWLRPLQQSKNKVLHWFCGYVENLNFDALNFIELYSSLTITQLKAKYLTSSAVCAMIIGVET